MTFKSSLEECRGSHPRGMKEFGADLATSTSRSSPRSRGILGVGSDEARILAAPKSAVAEASSLRTTSPQPADRGSVAADGAPVVETDADAADAETSAETPAASELGP